MFMSQLSLDEDVQEKGKIFFHNFFMYRLAIHSFIIKQILLDKLC